MTTRSTACTISALLILLSLILSPSLRAQPPDLWLMKAHDVRRTGQSRAVGPAAVDPDASWSVPLPGANVINVGASVDESGLFVGSWGIGRNPQGSQDPRTWDKVDGAVYGFALDGAPLWDDGRAELDLVPRCYEYAERPKDGNDIFWCGLLNPWHVSFYNGTVEGQAAIDTAREVMYVGRGDGKLYAIDRQSGAIRWRYVTFNPERPDDPDGGGEIVTSPLYDADGNIYVASWGEGAYETNAVYAIDPDGALRWRYPSATSLPHRFFASPALSPDGGTAYFATFVSSDSNINVPGVLYAFDNLSDTDLSGEQRLRWTLPLSLDGDAIILNTMAVGSDGTIYLGGSVLRDDANVPVVLAVRDEGTRGVLRWGTPYRVIEDGAQFVLGIALREAEGVTERLYVTTSNSGSPLGNWKTEGEIHAIDPATGDLLASYDPSDDDPAMIGGLNSPAIDAEGKIFVGVRGHYRGPFAPEAAPGHYIALTYDEAARDFTLLWSYRTDEHYVEWTHPAIGPDGGIYAGSAANAGADSIQFAAFAPGVTPEGTTPRMYGLKGPTSDVDEVAMSDGALLSEPWPNPFTSSVSMTLRLAERRHVRIEVVDVLGRRVATLVDRRLENGAHRIVWDGRGGDGRNVPAGIYWASITGGDIAVSHIPLWKQEIP